MEAFEAEAVGPGKQRSGEGAEADGGGGEGAAAVGDKQRECEQDGDEGCEVGGEGGEFAEAELMDAQRPTEAQAAGEGDAEGDERIFVDHGDEPAMGDAEGGEEKESAAGEALEDIEGKQEEPGEGDDKIAEAGGVLEPGVVV